MAEPNAAASVADTFPGSKTRHGTNSGWAKHVKAGERPCVPCYAAKQEYDRRRRAAGPTQVKSRQNARAQFRAYQALVREHPERYRELYAEAKSQVLAEDAQPNDSPEVS